MTDSIEGGEKVNKELNKIPILFQSIGNYTSNEQDIRFQEVKIWLMHLEENFNGSYFSREVVEEAIPTLANTPILAFIEKNENGQLDFSDHRTVLEISDDKKLKLKYLGKAIGVIPENNDAKFEERLCDDGKVRTFLTVKGLLWSKFDEPINIMNRDVCKAQSMELADDYEGEFMDDNLFHFTKFSFYGACGLGANVEPAMKNASIELQFSYNDFKNELNEKIEQFKKIYSSIGNKISTQSATSNYSKKEDDLVPKSKKEIAATFSLTVNQLYEELHRKLQEVKYETENWYGEKIEVTRYGLVDFDEAFIYVKDRKEGYIDVKIPYSKNGDDVSFDFTNVKRIKWTPTDWEDGVEEIEIENYTLKIIEEGKTEFSKLLANNKKLNEQLTEKDEALIKLNEMYASLQEQSQSKDKEIEALFRFKQQVEEQFRKTRTEELFAKYSKNLTKEETESLREKEKTFSKYEDFEREVKVFVADKIAEVVHKEQSSFNRIGIPIENYTESSDLWDRLSKK